MTDCGWNVVTTTQGTLRLCGDTARYLGVNGVSFDPTPLCGYHASRARRDGWAVRLLRGIDEDGEIPDRTIRQNGPQVIGERCPWCGALVLDSDHSRSHD
jgi:hypothetical protein